MAYCGLWFTTQTYHKHAGASGFYSGPVRAMALRPSDNEELKMPWPDCVTDIRHRCDALLGADLTEAGDPSDRAQEAAVQAAHHH